MHCNLKKNPGLNKTTWPPHFSEFSNERTRVERRENFRKIRIKENFHRAIDGYFDWIVKAGELYSLVGGVKSFTVTKRTTTYRTE